MASDFLKKLQESVDSGKENDAVKAVYNEILDKAEKYSADTRKMKQIEEKVDKAITKEGEELKKKLTAEEVAELNKLAEAEQERMLQYEHKTIITSGVIAVNCEIEKLEKTLARYKEGIQFLNGDAEYKEKKKLIDELIKEFNGD